MKDLVILVADKNMQFALKGALSRTESLGISPIQIEFIVHPGRDGGVRKSGTALLQLKKQGFEHALLVLDFEGCGTDLPNARAVEDVLDRSLSDHWVDCGKSIVIEPELDIWMWGANNALQSALNWQHPENVRDWLKKKDFSFDDSDKPTRPKEALEAILREVRLPRSSAIYEKIAQQISLTRCRDEAFLRLRETVRAWFPA